MLQKSASCCCSKSYRLVQLHAVAPSPSTHASSFMCRVQILSAHFTGTQQTDFEALPASLQSPHGYLLRVWELCDFTRTRLFHMGYTWRKSTCSISHRASFLGGEKQALHSMQANPPEVRVLQCISRAGQTGTCVSQDNRRSHCRNLVSLWSLFDRGCRSGHCAAAPESRSETTRVATSFLYASVICLTLTHSHGRTEADFIWVNQAPRFPIPQTRFWFHTCLPCGHLRGLSFSDYRKAALMSKETPPFSYLHPSISMTVIYSTSLFPKEETSKIYSGFHPN